MWLERIWSRVLPVLLALWHLFVSAFSRMMSSCPASLWLVCMFRFGALGESPTSEMESDAWSHLILLLPVQDYSPQHSPAFSSLFLNDSEERAFLSSLGRLALLFSRPHCWGIFFLFSSLRSSFPWFNWTVPGSTLLNSFLHCMTGANTCCQFAGVTEGDSSPFALLGKGSVCGTVLGSQALSETRFQSYVPRRENDLFLLLWTMPLT